MWAPTIERNAQGRWHQGDRRCSICLVRSGKPSLSRSADIATVWNEALRTVDLTVLKVKKMQTADRVGRTKSLDPKRVRQLDSIITCWTRRADEAAVTNTGAALCSRNCAGGLAALAKGKTFADSIISGLANADLTPSIVRLPWNVLWRFAQLTLYFLDACCALRESRRRPRSPADSACIKFSAQNA